MSACPRWALIFGSVLLAVQSCLGGAAFAGSFNGFNLIMVPGHPFGSDSARQSLDNIKRVGANTVAIIPFLWQANASSGHIQRGNDMSDDELRMAIRDAHALGLIVVVKPQVWIPENWAGAAEPTSEQDWYTWFIDYSVEIERIARIAAANHADILAIGTELTKTTQRPEWIPIIAAVRGDFSGKLLYFAHDVEEAEHVPFWRSLDAIGVTLYPSLGADNDRAGHLAAMRAVADRLDALSMRIGKPVWVGEIGLRSAVGAAAKPWESVEQRAAAPAPYLQSQVLSDWLSVLDRPSIDGVLIWRWLTDPSAGGIDDTDFMVQSKPAEGALMCAWKIDCTRR